MSVATLEVQDHQDLINLFGRGMNSELYKLPADKQEMDRLSLQHRIWKLMVDGLYPKEAEGAVQDALDLAKCNPGHTPLILDIGSGSGSWAVEMALRFPQAKVIGMDLIKSSPPGPIPENCAFIKANATDALAEYVGMFDVVQCRSVAKHVPDAVALTKSIARSLRPGGIFFFADASTPVYNEELKLYPLAPIDGANSTPTEDYCWFARWLTEVTERWTTKARQNTDGDKLHILIRENGQFEDVHENLYYSPIGWDGGRSVESANGAEIGRLMVLNVFDFLQSSKPSLLASGLSEDIVESWVLNVQKEGVDPSKHMFLKWVVSWAKKS